jgi:hypothetical protein
MVSVSAKKVKKKISCLCIFNFANRTITAEHKGFSGAKPKVESYFTEASKIMKFAHRESIHNLIYVTSKIIVYSREIVLVLDNFT